MSTKILVGMGLGIVAGVFFGEEVAFLGVVGEGFIQLLQMSVLPLVTVSLIVGLGRLTYDDALSLANKCGAVLLLLWVMAIAMVVVMPLAPRSTQAGNIQVFPGDSLLASSLAGGGAQPPPRAL